MGGACYHGELLGKLGGGGGLEEDCVAWMLPWRGQELGACYHGELGMWNGGLLPWGAWKACYITSGSISEESEVKVRMEAM